MSGRRNPPESPRATARRRNPENRSASRQLTQPVLLTLACLTAAPASADAFQSQRRIDPADNVSTELRTGAAPELVKGVGILEPSARPTLSLEMTAQLADNLALLFDRFEQSEFILCLEGGFEATGELRLADFRMPHLAYSRSTSAGVYPDGGCAQYGGIVGTVHNHPVRNPADRGREWKNCYLSRTDIVSWLEHSNYEYTAVMCGPRTWAWWHRSQVNEEKVISFPPPGQLFGRTETVSPRPE